MECPRDSTELQVERYQGIEVDKCPKCEGLWLDHPELDQLEDAVFDKDELKGMMEYSQRRSDIKCPRCDGRMTIFNYRAYNLPIDSCDLDHGFWLDKGEERQVQELMKKRIKDLDRSKKAEAEWFGFLNKLSKGKRKWF